MSAARHIPFRPRAEALHHAERSLRRRLTCDRAPILNLLSMRRRGLQPVAARKRPALNLVRPAREGGTEQTRVPAAALFVDQGLDRAATTDRPVAADCPSGASDGTPNTCERMLKVHDVASRADATVGSAPQPARARP